MHFENNWQRFCVIAFPVTVLAFVLSEVERLLSNALLVGFYLLGYAGGVMLLLSGIGAVWEFIGERRHEKRNK